jgi:hypothetical protein
LILYSRNVVKNTENLENLQLHIGANVY